MTDFQIIDAKPFHCGAMARALRGDHRRAVLALGVDVHRELRARFDASALRRAWLIDGQLAGLGGVTGMSLSAHGMIWLALAQEAVDRFPVAMMRTARAQLAQFMAIKRELVTVLLAGDAAAVRFALHLGFEYEAPDPRGHLVMRYHQLRKAA